MENPYIGGAPFLSDLSPPEQARLSERMRLERRSRGEILFRKGDESSALYLIQSGWVRLVGDGATAIASLGPGSLVGEADLFEGRPRTVAAFVAQDAELWTLTREDLTELIAEDPQIGIRLSLAYGSQLSPLVRYLAERRLKPLPWLAGVDDETLSSLAHRFLPLQKSAGEVVVEQGQPFEGLYVVESGTLTEDGAQVEPGTCFDEMALLTGRSHAHSIQAVTDAVLWLLPASEFGALCNEHPALRSILSQNLREPLREQNQAQAGERLSKMPLFSGLAPEVLQAVAEQMWVRHVPAGEVIYAEGTPGDALYLIDSGQVDIISSVRPRSAVLSSLGADAFFGEAALLTGKPRSSAARARTHTNLWVLSRTDFEGLVSRFPAIGLALSRVLSERLAEMDRRCTENQLRRMKLLAGLSSSQLEDISRRLTPVHFRQGQVILREGEPGEEMYFVESGRVRVVRGLGREARTLAELGPGDVFGEMALLTGSPRSATVLALSDTEAWALARADFDEVVSAYPNLALALGRLLSERLRSTDERLARAAPAVAPAPTLPATRPVPAARPVPVERPARRVPRAEPKRGLIAELRDAIANASAWFGSLSRGAKVRLVLISLLLIWLIFIATPALLISTLAAADVRDLRGAIAFVQTSTPPFAGSAGIAEAAAPAQAEAAPASKLQMVEEPVGASVGEALLFAAEPALEESAEPPTPEPPTPEAPTATPWIIVVTNTPLPVTDTPVPTATPIPPTSTPTPARARSAPAAVPMVQPTATSNPQIPRELDPRLGALNVHIAEPAGLQPGQTYFRLVRVIWQDPQESGNDHTIYIEVLDENGNRILNQPVEIRWPDGSQIVYVEDKPPPAYGANYPMYGTLGSYTVSIPGAPSDMAVGLGMGTPEFPGVKFHTNFLLVFRRTQW